MKRLDQIQHWQQMLNEVVQGDCLEGMKMIPDKSIDLILTDPPYGVSFKKSGEIYLPGDGINLMPVILPELYRILKDDGGIFIFASCSRLQESLLSFQIYFKLHNIIIWDKVTPNYPFSEAHYRMQYEPIMYGSKGLHYLRKEKISDIIQASIPRGKIRKHPTQKPVELLKQILSSTQNNKALILDPFMGSWSTAEACKDLGRNFIGFELEEKYCRTGEERLKQEVLF